MARTYERVGFPLPVPSFDKSKGSVLHGFPRRQSDLAAVQTGKGDATILSKMTGFHLAARGAKLATSRPARAAVGPRQTRPGRPVWEPSL
jgi:hypothetical protein